MSNMCLSYKCIHIYFKLSKLHKNMSEQAASP